MEAAVDIRPRHDAVQKDARKATVDASSRYHARGVPEEAQEATVYPHCHDLAVVRHDCPRHGSAWECMGVHGSAWECMGVHGHQHDGHGGEFVCMFAVCSLAGRRGTSMTVMVVHVSFQGALR